MTLKIRLLRTGKKGQAYYKIIVAPARSKRDGKTIDLIGHYNPQTNPPLIKLDDEKYQRWKTNGAQVSDGLRKILDNQGK